MPELPEVETISNYLNKKISGLIIVDFWTDWKKSVKCPKNLDKFKKEIIGRKIIKVSRMGKNILIHLSENKLILIHQKMTGHLLLGKWKIIKFQKKENAVSQISGPLSEKVNDFIHAIFYLSGKKDLALSDLRKFAKIMAGDKNKIENLPDLKNLGPNPIILSCEEFKNILKRKHGKIKIILMDQEVFAGIGNIYSDEILWFGKIHPLTSIQRLSDANIKNIYKYMKKVLLKAVKLRGTSISDYRDPEGKAGDYADIRRVYRRENKPCSRCHTLIKRIKIGGRSAHFCPVCQKY